MATLVLSAVGGLIGGKAGRAVGSVIGLAIDRRLFAPKGRQGPRLGDLAFQSSNYGALIPKLYGTNRVAGTVIWAVDLREDRKKVSSGKGQPKTTIFSYSASFAVALSARRVLRVGRIWADGNLLRGTADDFKTQTGFRLHSGGEGQTVDPLIASAEGVSATPAYNGIAYAVFENLQLGDFGNRIPSLSFEVIADEGEVTIGDIIKDMAGAGVTTDCPTTIVGFAAYGDSVRGAIDAIANAAPFSVCDDGASLKFFEQGATARGIIDRDLGAARGDERAPRLPIQRRSASTIPETLSLSYYEPSRDYQQGVQRARRDGGARRESKIDLPVVLSSVTAKHIAEVQLDRIWAGRVEARLRLPWRRLDLLPGQHVAVEGSSALWRISAANIDRMAVEIDLTRLGEGRPTASLADAGRGISQGDTLHGPTTFHLIDLPAIEVDLASAPRVVVAAAGVSTGWRRAALLMSIDGGNSWEEAGVTAAPATIGVARTVLGAGSSCLIDEANSVDVELLNHGMELPNTDATGLDTMKNLAMLGNELIQFRSAMPLGANRYRLSGLYRGRRGTEWAISSHLAGERFTLIERDALAAINVPTGTANLWVMAIGVGEGAAPPVHSLLVPGQAVMPIAPVHFTNTRLPGGSRQLGWKRRSRNGWRWIDMVDAPLAEEQERYVVSITGADGTRQTETNTNGYLYDAIAQDADRAAGSATVTVSVAQIGTFGPSRSISQTIALTPILRGHSQ